MTLEASIKMMVDALLAILPTITPSSQVEATEVMTSRGSTIEGEGKHAQVKGGMNVRDGLPGGWDRRG